MLVLSIFLCLSLALNFALLVAMRKLNVTNDNRALEVDDLRQENQSLVQKLKNLSAERSQLRVERDKLRRQLSEAASDLASCSLERKAIGERLVWLERELEKYKQEPDPNAAVPADESGSAEPAKDAELEEREAMENAPVCSVKPVKKSKKQAKKGKKSDQ